MLTDQADQAERAAGVGSGQVYASSGGRGVASCAEDVPCYAGAAELGAGDVQVQFLRVRADGALAPIADGAAMRAGERFTIIVHAVRDAHVYLYHRDPTGRVEELIRASGLLGGDCRRHNRLSAGQRLRLPNLGEHYALGGVVGTERVQLVASPTAICDDRRRVEPVGTPGSPCGSPGVHCPPPFTIRHVTEI